MSELRALLDLITKSVNAIEASCGQRNVPFPPLDEPFTPPSEAARMHPDVLPHISIIASAAHQLVCTVRMPPTSIINDAFIGFLPQCMRAACELHVAEILRDAGPDGLHVDKIAAKNKVDPKKLSRVLRYLATHHYFRELTPEVFANNRLSSALDKGQPVDKLLSNPECKYEKSRSAIAALACHLSDDPFKGAGWIYESMVDPTTWDSEEIYNAPASRALNWTPNESYWAWLERPQNKERQNRFGVAMEGVNSLQPPDTILKGFDWANLAKGSVVVDVGGGIGSVAMEIAKAAPHVNIVIQDRPPVIEDAIKFWTRNYEVAIKENRVTFQAHDFFKEQPVKNAAVFLLKQVTHDWSDSYVAKILTALRAAAGPNTQLVVMESIIPYASRDQGISATIPGASRPAAPLPLLANMGAADAIPYNTDLTMLACFNATERTLGHLVALWKKTGWNVIKIHYNDPAGLFLPHIIAVPI